jgi:hypothetical protein
MTIRTSATLVAFAASAFLAACRSTRDATAAGEPAAVGDTAVIDGRTPSCATCSLELGPAMRVGSRADREIAQRVPHVVRDHAGRLYLTFDDWGNQPILRYDSAGRYLGRLGANGNGPGEYDMTGGTFVDKNDSVYVVGWGSGYLHIFGPDGGFGRTIMVPTRVKPFGVGEDGLIYAWRLGGLRGGVSTSAVHRLARDGSIRDSFPIYDATGIDSVDIPGRGRTGIRYGDFSRPTLGDDGKVWTYMRGNYRLENHGAFGGGRQLFGLAMSDSVRPVLTHAETDSQRAVTREAIGRSGGKRAADSVIDRMHRSPKPTINARVDADGLVWIARTIGAPKWDTITVRMDKLAPNEAPDEETMPRDIEDRLYHTVIEVFDPVRRALIARTEVPFLAQLAAPGHIARVTTDYDGFYVTTVYPLKLKR